MPYLKSKREITEIVLAELGSNPQNVWSELPIDDVVFRWWYTGRGGTGLRLTEDGMKAFSLATLTFYDFPVGIKSMKNMEWEQFIKKITKKVACPYFLGVYRDRELKETYIRIYDNKIAMLLTLYGTLNDYMDSVK